MSTLCAGIDEAGYGPVLGPLAVVAVHVRCDDPDRLASAFTGTGVTDSKRLHRPGDLAPLERVALAGMAWLAGGHHPVTAAECFAALGEDAAARADTPWMAGAEALRLPLAAQHIPTWQLDGLAPSGVNGRLLHPVACNAALASGRNKADLELATVQDLLRALPAHARGAVLVDRLGGRRYYRDAVQAVWPQAQVVAECESERLGAYSIRHPAAVAATADAALWSVAFQVDGEAASPLTALASCLAKYARELHMALLNRWWSADIPGLKPTAGYVTDARRWLDAIGVERWHPHARRLVRDNSGVATPPLRSGVAHGKLS